MADRPVLELTSEGLYFPEGDFHIDPWQPVERAVITHAHSDHARWGCQHYLATKISEPILRARLGQEISLQILNYGEKLSLNQAKISLHPAGHIPGSAQVRVEVNGEVWVVTGDYKTEPDKTATPFELVKCHGFVTETTFGLPIYNWKPEKELMQEMRDWWHLNQADRRPSLLFGYALGKAQRMIAGIADGSAPILVHGAVHNMNQACRSTGVDLPTTKFVTEATKEELEIALVVAPPSAFGTPWMPRFKNSSTAFASGWMSIRGARRRRGVDRGFVLSDHVDWPALLQTIKETGAETIWTTHGYAHPVARYLTELGYNAHPLETQFRGETDEDPENEESASA